MNMVRIHWRILSYSHLIPLFLLVSIILTVINTFSTFFFDCRVGPINPGTFSAALTFRCSGVHQFSLWLSRYISHSLSALQTSSLLFGLSKSPFQWRQFSVSEMLSGELCSSVLAGWPSIRLIGWTFNRCVHPPWRFFADKAGSTGDFSDNYNAATPSCWKFDQNALTISLVSEMYPIAVICVFWAWDSVSVARRFWLPCHIVNKLWTLAIRCNFFSSASLFIFMSLSMLLGSNAGSSPASNPLLARANCLTKIFLERVSPVIFDCLHPITSHLSEKLASTAIPCSMIENMSHATLERSGYFECVSSCCRHQLVISGNQNVPLISIGLEW